MRELRQDLFRRFSGGEAFQGVFEFVAAGAFGVVAQPANQGDDIAGCQPVQKTVDLRVDNGFRLNHRRLTGFHAAGDDLRQVVYGV